MNKNRQAWIIVGALFAMWFFVWGGGLNTTAVFFPALLKSFGWSRARLSAGIAAGAVCAGLVGPVVGWLLDRFDARNVMVAGVAMIGFGYFGISRTHAFEQFLIMNLIVGAGFSAATGIPTSVVIANWFTARRGLAMGIAFAGASIGGAAMTIVA
ncbi:MAG TPA: MFS transporter, partial [Candidatus Binataceae bacterium]|nr:MFS transporter [Candidatus Binataceae bacterium]